VERQVDDCLTLGRDSAQEGIRIGAIGELQAVGIFGGVYSDRERARAKDDRVFVGGVNLALGFRRCAVGKQFEVGAIVDLPSVMLDSDFDHIIHG
jgi:hypothetical protein